MIKDLPLNELRDVNIDIQDPKTVMLEVIEKTQGKQNITVLLCSDHLTYEETVQFINSTWKSEYAHYMKDNNIDLEIVNLKRNYELEDIRKVKPKNKTA